MATFEHPIIEKLAEMHNWAWGQVREMSNRELLDVLERVRMVDDNEAEWSIRMAAPQIESMVLTELRVRKGLHR